MKKALILLTAAALLLTACAGSGNPSSEGSSQQSSQSSPEAAPVTAEELIEPAMEAYTWCMVYSLPATPTTPFPWMDGPPTGHRPPLPRLRFPISLSDRNFLPGDGGQHPPLRGELCECGRRPLQP